MLAVFSQEFIISKVHSVHNTNNAVKKMIKPNRCVALIAAKPDYGKTQKGEDWVINKGNLHMSIGIETDHNHNLHHLVFLTAIAIGRVLKDYNPKYKWPNDVFIYNKKVCGILIERENNKLVIGIGINVVCSPTQAIYLNKYKKYNLDVLPEQILHSLKEVEKELNTFATIKNAWQKYALFINKDISFNDGDKITCGKFVGIADDGSLLLKCADVVNKIFLALYA